jgi:hypothetical protein
VLHAVIAGRLASGHPSRRELRSLLRMRSLKNFLTPRRAGPVSKGPCGPVLSSRPGASLSPWGIPTRRCPGSLRRSSRRSGSGTCRRRAWRPRRGRSPGSDSGCCRTRSRRAATGSRLRAARRAGRPCPRDCRRSSSVALSSSMGGVIGLHGVGAGDPVEFRLEGRDEAGWTARCPCPAPRWRREYMPTASSCWAGRWSRPR